MKICRLSVMRMANYSDLSAQLENPMPHPCDLELGQVFYTRGRQPSGLCDSAWATLSPFVMALGNGATGLYDGWMKDPASAMVSCNDGFRPVSFLVEALDGPAIRPIQPEDIDQTGDVYCAAWQETYPGMAGESDSAALSPEQCGKMAREWPGEVFVAELGGKIMGFCGCGPSRDEDGKGFGEIYAIYLLKCAQGLGIGKRLLDAAFRELLPGPGVTVWVRKENRPAIGFYEHCGFRADGAEKTLCPGKEAAVRMVWHSREDLPWPI